MKDRANEEIKNRETDSFKDKLEKLGQTLLGKEIKWNFTKFLIGKDGEIIGRFSPTVTPVSYTHLKLDLYIDVEVRYDHSCLLF